MHIHPERGRPREAAEDPVHEPSLADTHDGLAETIERLQVGAVQSFGRQDLISPFVQPKILLGRLNDGAEPAGCETNDDGAVWIPGEQVLAVL
jgi:hypothetical protein